MAMYQHKNRTQNQHGITVAHHVDSHLRCSHCANDGMVSFDDPVNGAAPCPNCTYGMALAEKAEVAPSLYRGLTWENGLTLEHTMRCEAPRDRREPDGYRCRRAAVPSATGTHAICDSHREGSAGVMSEAAVAYVETARARSAMWKSIADERREREVVA